MIRITTDRAIRKKIEEIREREFEKRMIFERFEQLERKLDDIKDLYGDAHRLMNAIEYDEKLDHLDDEDFEIIWSHIKAHYELK